MKNTIFTKKIFSPSFLRKDFREIENFIFEKFKSNLLTRLSQEEVDMLETKHSFNVDPNEPKIVLTLLDRLLFESRRHTSYFHLPSYFQCSFYIYDCEKLTSLDENELIPFISKINDKWKNVVNIKAEFRPSRAFNAKESDKQLFLDFEIL